MNPSDADTPDKDEPVLTDDDLAGREACPCEEHVGLSDEPLEPAA